MQKNKHSETLHTSDPDAGNLAKGQKSVPKKKVPSGSGNGENGKRENHTQLHHAPEGTLPQSDTRQVRRLIWCKVRKSFIQQVPPAAASLRLEIEPLHNTNLTPFNDTVRAADKPLSTTCNKVTVDMKN